MSFNSIEFTVFLPIVFFSYWFLIDQKSTAQNLLLVIASYCFYGWWDWRFLIMIACSTFVDYCVGISLKKSENKTKRKILLLISIFINIGFLLVFKYANFFLENFYNTFVFLGKPISDPILLDIILPIGISFYTFQTLSYSIDIYRERLEPAKDIISFFAFVSFFPQLVAGPIERASNLLPAFYQKRVFKYDEITDGLRQILWGLFKKIVIADNCAIYVNEIFSNYTNYNASTLVLGAIFFSFQIYGDFSGYSDMAIGISHLFGFKLMQNFSQPYFSRDIAEFWRKWHISLSTWFRDYVYIPMGGNRNGGLINIRNIFITFILSGFWHGANWTFIIWGALNAIYFLPLVLLKKHKANNDIIAQGRLLPNPKEILQMGTTFILVSMSWIFFRSENLSQALSYLWGIFSGNLLSIPDFFPKKFILVIILFVLIEWLQRDYEYALQTLNNNYPILYRWSLYYGIILIIWLSINKYTEFVYFHF